jgi:hypothetical protein
MEGVRGVMALGSLSRRVGDGWIKKSSEDTQQNPDGQNNQK